jgi:hypothetical protein
MACQCRRILGLRRRCSYCHVSSYAANANHHYTITPLHRYCLQGSIVCHRPLRFCWTIGLKGVEITHLLRAKCRSGLHGREVMPMEGFRSPISEALNQLQLFSMILAQLARQKIFPQKDACA